MLVASEEATAGSVMPARAHTNEEMSRTRTQERRAAMRDVLKHRSQPAHTDITSHIA
jgi:hypothetical protein